MIPLRNRYYTAMVLPFAADGSIDEPALRDLIRYYLADKRYAKVGGLIANPEAGEVYYLTPAEKRRVVEITMEEAGGKMPVFAGIFEMTTAGCVESAREMKVLGVDGLFLMPPAGCLDLVTMWNAERYPEYWLDQIKAIDAAADLPIIAHPVGPVTPQWGIGIPGETARLICREVENVIAWKMTYSYDGMRRMWTILRSLERPVSILAAGGKLFHEYMAYDIMDGTASGVVELRAGSHARSYRSLAGRGSEAGAPDLGAGRSRRAAHLYLCGLFAAAPALQDRRMAARPDPQLPDARANADRKTGRDRHHPPAAARSRCPRHRTGRDRTRGLRPFVNTVDCFADLRRHAVAPEVGDVAVSRFMPPAR